MSWIKTQLQTEGGYDLRVEKYGTYKGVKAREPRRETWAYEDVSVSGCTINSKAKGRRWFGKYLFQDGKTYEIIELSGHPDDIREIDSKNIEKDLSDPRIAVILDGDSVYDLREYAPTSGVSMTDPFGYWRRPKPDWSNVELTDKQNSTFPSVTMTTTAGAKEQPFYFHEVHLAERFARAINHAITLCGGKNEPF